jgi:hypothetical protein
MDKEIFEKFDKESSFIKVTTPASVEGSQKAALNRKGNQLFNDGNIEGAKRVFLTTGYSDGLARVGDYYKSQNRPMDALKMYWIAPDRKKSEPLIEQLAGILQSMIQEDDENSPIGEDSLPNAADSSPDTADTGSF